MLKDYAGGASKTTLASDITASSTTIAVADATGWPAGGAAPFVGLINRGNAGAEKILFSSRTGNTLTVATDGRGYDQTTAATHTAGENVEHVLDAITVREANVHANDASGSVHVDLLNNADHDTTSRHGSGVVDHGSIAGLADADHPQYVLGTANGQTMNKAAIDALGVDAATLGGTGPSGYTTDADLAAHPVSNAVVVEAYDLTSTGNLKAGAGGTIEEFDVTLPSGWTSMSFAVHGFVTATVTSQSGSKRATFEFVSPSGTTITTAKSQVWFEDNNTAVERGTSAPLSAVVAGPVTGTQLLRLRGLITRGTDDQVQYADRLVVVTKHRIA